MSRKSKGPQPTRKGSASSPQTSQLPAALPSPAIVPREWYRQLKILAAILAFLVAFVFLRVTNNEFVNYDDPDYITSNRHVLDGLSWPNITWALTAGHASNWHPATWWSHMLDAKLFHDAPAGHHVVSVLLHIANTLLLFLWLVEATASAPRAALVAALFALHPLHVESVAWASERKDVLSAFFFLLTLLAYTRYAKTLEAADLKKSRLKYALALTFFAVGLMSKPMLVTVPFVLLLMDIWPLSRWCPSAKKLAPDSSLLMEKLPFLALSLASCVITFFAQRHGGAVSSLGAISIKGRIENAIVAYIRYLLKMFWPVDLAVLYPHPIKWPFWQVVACAVILIAVSLSALYALRRHAYASVGWFWFLGMLVPVIGLVQVGLQSMADRYTYLPLIGLFIVLVWGVADITAGWRWRTELMVLGPFTAVLVCAFLSIRQIRIWHDSESLFRHTAGVTTGNFLAYNNLGFYLAGRGQDSEAIENYRRAIEINPAYEDGHNNLGYALAKRKQYDEAIAHYLVALRIRTNHVEVHNNLGNALADIGKLDDAIGHYEYVLQQKPDHADAHNNLGIALSMKGRLDEAIPHFHEAIRYKTNYASAHSNLGNALAAQRKLDDAIGEYREALRLNPNDSQANNNLANVLTELGRLAEAIPMYSNSIRLNPDNPEAHLNLGTALARQGDRTGAIAHYTSALKFRTNYPEAQRQLELLQAMPPER